MNDKGTFIDLVDVANKRLEKIRELNARISELEAERDAALARAKKSEALLTMGNGIMVEAAYFAELEAKNARLRGALEGLAERDCEYGDNCPTFGARHGRCVGCIARAALKEE